MIVAAINQHFHRAERRTVFAERCVNLGLTPLGEHEILLKDLKRLEKT
jgi:hypothetical protein